MNVYFSTWEELVQVSTKFDKIIVTGCQRSGTTYTANILSNYIKYVHYDERQFEVDNIIMFEEILNKDEKQVIHAPALLHKMEDYDDIALIVVLHRNVDDVVSSMIHHEWFNKNGRYEWSKFSNDFTLLSPLNLYNLKIQFSNKLNKIDFKYDELEKTSGFVYKHNRVNWAIKQIKL